MQCIDEWAPVTDIKYSRTIVAQNGLRALAVLAASVVAILSPQCVNHPV